jgi:hypothetical protein
VHALGSLFAFSLTPFKDTTRISVLAPACLERKKKRRKGRKTEEKQRQLLVHEQNAHFFDLQKL